MADLTSGLQQSLGDSYTIERELGGGGMSRVFIAEDVSLGRRVALKVLPPELAGPLNADRFRREILLAARLQDPHIVPVLSAGQTADGTPYYTMPLVDGESLRARLARHGAMPVADTLRILRDVAKALAYAHERMGDGRLYVVDLVTGGRVRLAGETRASEPVWLSDGRRVVFARGNVPTPGLLEQPADASGPPDTLFIGATESFPTSISPDDSLVLFYSTGTDDPVDLYVIDRATRAVRRLSMPGAQRGGRFSPNGRWIAYQSNDAGQMDIYVRPWPSLNARYVVSTEGGEEPVWSSDGRELYYRNGDRIMAVRISEGATFSTSRPVQLFHGPYPRDPWGDQSFDVAPDGRFLMLRVSEGSPLQLFIVQNWFSEIRRQLRQ